MCWDNPSEFSPTVLTYSCLVERAISVCNVLRTDYQSTDATPQSPAGARLFPPVAIYGRSCPEVLCALLGIMAVPAPYMPLDLGQPSANWWPTLRACGVHTLLVEVSLFSVSAGLYLLWNSS